MAETQSMEQAGQEDIAPAKKPRRWPVYSFFGILAFVAAAVLVFALWLDSDAGHEYIVSQIEAQKPADGLRIKIGSIEGSIYRNTSIRQLELHDPKGRFFTAGEVALDWRPLAWIFNELNIKTAVVSTSRLERLPELVPSTEDKPILPDFDIYIGAFRADNIAIGAAITGEEQRADLAGAIDVTAGRAMINIDAATTRSGDKIALVLNAEPDKRKLDLNADINAPEDGVIDRYLGLGRPVTARLDGDGIWDAWDGRLFIRSDAENLTNLSLSARDGIIDYDGSLSGSLFPSGLARNLAGNRVSVTGKGGFEDGLANIDLTARSAALSLVLDGGFDLSRNTLDAMRVDAVVRNPPALSSNLRAQDLQAKLLLNGPLSKLRYQYLLTAPQLAIGKSLFTGVRAEGEGARDQAGFDIPVNLKFATLIGNGELFRRLANGFDGTANLRLENDVITAQNARFASDTISGTAYIAAPLSAGEYRVDVDAIAPGFAINGVGLADIKADLLLSPSAGKLGVDGLVNARLRRFDNAFLRELGGGLPALDSRVSLGADRKLRFTNLKVSAPKVSFTGSGVQTGAATYFFEGNGSHAEYGPFGLELDGPLSRPQIALLLDSPLPGAGLKTVRVNLTPQDNGFAFTAAGGSTLGPFDADGAIIARRGADALVRVDRLLVSDTVATGIIYPTQAGLAGDLDITGGGINGKVRFDPGDGRQVIEAKLVAKDARFRGNVPITIRTGTLDADLVLIDGRSNVKATLQAQGITRGNLTIGRMAGTANLSNGSGAATFSIAGTRGSTFNFQAKANIRPDRFTINGNGRFEGRALRLTRPVVLSRNGNGWSASQTTLAYGGGTARVSGGWNDSGARIAMNLSKMPLSLFGIADEELGLGGLAYGSLNLRQQGSQTPTGTAKLTIKGLTRSGLILTSTPVDLGLNMALSNSNAAARGIIKSGDKTIGRFQGRVTGMGNGNWKDELLRRPLFAQARFNGSADSLWRLTGVETFDLTGPLQVSADMRGTLANPQIDGRVAARGARLESGLTGTVVTGINANGSFDGSRLVLSRISGNTRGGGTVSGSGSFDFAVEAGVGVGIELNATARNAALIARDDFSATVSGPIRVRNGPDGGLISGDVTLNRSFFQFGQASETARLPEIKTREINRRADERPVRVSRRPWRFDIAATAPNRLQVEGLGLDSEWRADLRLTGPVDNFAMTGSARLINGNYTFAGRRFRLERGDIRFVGNQPPNPILDIEAEANLTGLNATINVTGSGNRPEIAFNSIPALPQDELLSRVLFGASISDLSAPEAVQLAAAVASLNSGGGLDPINQLRKAVGLDRLRILPSDVATGQGTSIAAGKYITRRAYVELITDGQGYSATRLEFQITRWLSILSSISTLGRQSANVRVSKDY